MVAGGIAQNTSVRGAQLAPHVRQHGTHNTELMLHFSQRNPKIRTIIYDRKTSENPCVPHCIYLLRFIYG